MNPSPLGLSLGGTPGFLLQLIPPKPASLPSHTKHHPTLRTAEGVMQIVRRQLFFLIQLEKKKILKSDLNACYKLVAKKIFA